MFHSQNARKSLTLALEEVPPSSRAKSQEPRAKSQEPRAKSQEPRAKSQEPRAKSQEPRCGHERASGIKGRRLPV